LALTLAAPQNVSLAPGSGKITVQWDAVTLADSYKVYYSTAATRPEEAAQNDLTGTSAVISGLSNDTPYHVWVQAVNLGGGGAVSGAAQISLTLEAPQTVTLSAGDGSLTASWGAVTLADSYKVYVSDTSVRPQEAAQTATGTSALVSGLSNNATYHVWVQAVNAGGESAFSEPAQVLLPVQFTVSNSAGLASAIASINAAGTGDYVITLAASITSGPITFTGNASKTITVMRNNASPSLVNGGGGALVTISGSITLILDKDITLDGNAQSYPVVNILSGGTFIMNNNSTVMGGRISGVGIRNASGVRSQGTFIMNGGTISGNSSTGYSTSAQARGGGVYIESGIFTMNGGTISGNSSAASSADYHARAYGGGVYIKSGIFTMSGGTISDNSCTSTATTWVGAYGGGVCIEEGTFMVSGGTISGNSSTARNNVYGGGVSIIHRRGIFTMRSGTISGNSSVYGGGVSFADGVFTKTGGTIDDTKWGVRGVQTPRRGVAGQGPAEGAAQDLPLCAKSFRSFACGKAGARGRLPPLFRLLPVSPVYS
jgi:hypothetical protein